MPYVAQLDQAGRCFAVSELAALPVGPQFVAVDAIDRGLLGRTYAGGQWGAAPPPPTAQRVTMRQARLALLAAGLLDDVEAAIDAMPDATERAAARITWDHSQDVERSHALVAQLAAALGLTGAQLDDLFAAAAAL